MEKNSKEYFVKEAMTYFDLMQDKLKEWHGKKVKSPFQLEKAERPKFFKKVKEIWKKEKPKKDEKKEEKKEVKSKK